MRAVGEADALLIGNQGYSTKIGALKNPHADIALVGAALRSLDFKVTEIKDADYKAVDTAIKRHIQAVRRSPRKPSRPQSLAEHPSIVFRRRGPLRAPQQVRFRGRRVQALASRYSSGPSRNPGLEAHQFGAT